MPCDRCQPDRPCLNCESEKRSRDFLKRRSVSESRVWIDQTAGRAFDLASAVMAGRARYERNAKEVRGRA